MRLQLSVCQVTLYIFTSLEDCSEGGSTRSRHQHLGTTVILIGHTVEIVLIVCSTISPPFRHTLWGVRHATVASATDVLTRSRRHHVEPSELTIADGGHLN